MRAKPSLRALAVGWLAGREHSERELRRKLLTRLRRDAAAGTARDAPAAGDADGQAVDRSSQRSTELKSTKPKSTR